MFSSTQMRKAKRREEKRIETFIVGQNVTKGETLQWIV
jgi:hypothetical protein